MPEEERVGIEFRRDQDFLNRYANNVYFESTVWDLKFVFGQTDLAAGQNIIVQHTAITIPWPFVKILAYLLETQIVTREAESGHITVPPNILVPPSDNIPEESLKRIKHAKEQFQAVVDAWERFLENNPEVKPT